MISKHQSKNKNKMKYFLRKKKKIYSLWQKEIKHKHVITKATTVVAIEKYF